MSDRFKFIVRRAQVPPLHKRYVRPKRYSWFETTVEEFLEKACNGQAVLAITGLSGSGKTALVQDLLWSRSDLFTDYFRRVLFVADGNTDVRRVDALLINILVLLAERPPAAGDLAVWKAAPRAALQRVLDRASFDLLLVVDNVLLAETVRQLVGLDLAVVFTSPREDLFGCLEDVTYYRMGGAGLFDADDVVRLAEKYGLVDILPEHAALIHKLTQGNFALLEKLFTASDGRMERLHFLTNQLVSGSWDRLHGPSYYRHRSLATPLNELCSFLDEPLRRRLTSLALVRTGAWLPLELLMHLWSVDSVDVLEWGTGFQMMTSDLRQIGALSLVALSGDQFWASPVVRYFLLSQTNAFHLALYRKFVQRLQADKSHVELVSEDYFEEVDPIDVEAVLSRRMGTANEERVRPNTLWQALLHYLGSWLGR